MQLFEINEPRTNNNLEPSKQVSAIGIDLGTTNSLVAFSINQRPCIIQNQDGEDILPSIVYEYPKNILNVGKTANHYRIVKSVKRLIGKSFNEIRNSEIIQKMLGDILLEDNINIKLKLTDDQVFSPEEISAKILATLKQNAENYFGYPINKAVITVPAYFNDTERNATIFAAKLAGLEVLRLISEPTAAAYAYGLDKEAEGYFLVYDLGGGTFDISLLNMEMGVFQVIATNGHTSLGGDDIDLVIYNYFRNLLKSKYDIHDLSDNLSKQLFHEAKKAKEAFSHQTEVNFTINNIDLTLNLVKFNELIYPIINTTIEILSETIKISEINKNDIKGIILVGGSTRIKLIKQLLHQQLQLPIYDDVDPDRVVALGAALQAENLTIGSQNLVIDVTPLSLGIELMGGVVDKLIPRNTPIPYMIKKEFTTYKDDQTGMQFHIVQGDREMASDCRSLTSFELIGIPPMKAGCARVEVTFNLDTDGILFIKAYEKNTGISQEVTLKPSYGLDSTEMHKMLQAAFLNAEEDHKLKLLQETIIEAEQTIEILQSALINAIENINIVDFKEEDKSLNDIALPKYPLQRKEYFLIEEAIQQTKNMIKNNDRQKIIDSLQHLEKVANNFITNKMSQEISQILKGQKV